MIGKYTFISYHHLEREVAGSIKEILNSVDINAFLAHEDIQVSEEWQIKIFKEIAKTTIYIAILSENFVSSAWCVQESGIAVYRNMTIIPLSIDGTIPQGFISKYQSTRINPDSLSLEDLLPGLAKHDINWANDLLVTRLAKSSSFRNAETNFDKLSPYLDKLNKKQIKKLMDAIINNSQIHNAKKCASRYIPPLLTKYGNLLSKDDLDHMWEVCEK